MKIVLDIETLQPNREEWAFLQGKDTDSAIIEDKFIGDEGEQNEKAYQKAAFDATFSRIICIGLLTLNDDLSPTCATAWYGSDEKALLQQFWVNIDIIRPRLIITHNGLGFDLPFLKKRSIINRVKPTIEINLAKYRTAPVYDTMAVWANWEIRNFIKLDVLARTLGVETKSGSGDQISNMWASGKKKEVAEYCLKDTYVTYACYCRITFNEPNNSSTVLAKKVLYEID